MKPHKYLILLVLFDVLGCRHDPRGVAQSIPDSAGSSSDRHRIISHNIAAPRFFQLGRPATKAEIAAWDLDVMPNGEGLPEGQGSVEAGRDVYATACARCHGAKGEGGPFDPLVGRIAGDAFPFAEDPRIPKTIGSYWPWATTLFDYVRRAMPQDRPGSLTNNEVYSLTAYLLYLNELFPADGMLDRRSLPQIVMPARERFVPDDRRGGLEVR